MGSSSESSYFGPVKNPWNHGYVPGGSSGGSAAAVAARLVPAATGTDTGGSIRQPAALSGVCGLKPTYGVCSRYGLVAFASSLDTPGAFAQTAEDCALLLNAMAGHDPRDSTSLARPAEDYARLLRQRAPAKPLAGLRIGLPREYCGDGIDAKSVTKVFDPYFTTKPAASGLGLSISYSVIKKHGGFLQLENTSSDGSTFAFYLPATDAEPQMPQPTLADEIFNLNHQRVLVMDDEAAIRDLTSELLSTLGYKVTVVPDGAVI